LGSEPSIKDLIKTACKKLGHKDYKIVKLYSKDGVELFQDDMIYIKEGDILYIALKGK
jgi:hypothetical protein